MNINVVFSGLQNFFRAGAYGSRLFGGVPFFGPVANQMGAAGGLLSLFAKFGRLGGILTSFGTAVAAVTAVTVRAANLIRNQGMAGLSMGGTTAQGLQLRGFAGAAGLSMEQMGALGEQVGGFNRSQRLLQEINTIRSLARWEDVLLYTRGRGLESLQQVWFLTNEQSKALDKEAQAREGLYGLQATAKAVQFNYELEKLKTNFNDLTTVIGLKLIPPVNWVVEKLNSLANFVFPANDQRQHAEAMRAHTAALNGSARTMGGGPRAQNAIAPALKGEQFNDAARRRALTFGALIPG